MMRVLLLLSALVACALGHAVMISPVPLNTNPTTANPCGVATLPTAPSSAATWGIGTEVTVQWKLVAGDGGSSATGTFNPSGNTNFNPTTNTGLVGAGFTLATPTVGSTFSQKFTVPAVDCSAAPGGLCLFRMVSNVNNWNSCTYVNVTTCDNCPTPAPPQKKCTQFNNAGNGLGFCYPSLSYQSVEVDILEGDDPVVIVNAMKLAYNANINNTNVFLAGNTTACKNAYRTFLCALDLPPCGGSDGKFVEGSACKQMCENALTQCQLNPLHEALYDCSTLQDCPGTSSASTLVASGAVVATAVAAMLF